MEVPIQGRQGRASSTALYDHATAMAAAMCGLRGFDMERIDSDLGSSLEANGAVKTAYFQGGLKNRADINLHIRREFNVTADNQIELAGSDETI